MSTAKNITVIPATVDRRTRSPITATARRRVAGYARVSTDSEEQQTSYGAQVDYYTKYIQSKPEWKFVGVYTDEGISALDTRHRTGFNEMVQAALHGDIDLIITKSVSRFARNTVDSLSTIRKLKEAGCECYFEKEQIFTFDGKGELLLTIMSSLAQEESRSISENVTWGQRKRFADGKVSIAYKQFLGYEKGPDGLPQIVENEAKTVREIYRMFMGGKTPGAIARHLTVSGIPTPAGKSNWQGTTVESILTNEKYKGAALLQKKYTVDFLTKKMKVNEGEVPQYYVENSHPAIILPDEFNKVQAEMTRRKASGKRHSCVSPFSSKIICGDCGECFTPKVWHSTDKYRRVIWQCTAKYKHEHPCGTPHLYEDEIKALFLTAFGKLMSDRSALLEDCRLAQSTLTDCTETIEECDELLREMDIVSELIRKCVEENASTTLDQSEYLSRYESYVVRFDGLKARYDVLQRQTEERNAQSELIGGFMFEIMELQTLPIEFSESVWNAVIDHITVYADERIAFTFKSGTTIEERL